MRAAAGSIVLLVALAAVAAPFHDDDLPLLASGSGVEGGWVSFRLHADASALVAIDVEAFGVELPNMIGTFVYHANKTLDFGLLFTAVEGESGVLISSTLPPSVHLGGPITSVEGGNMSSGLTFTQEAGTFYVVLFMAGVQSSWTHALRAEAPVTLEATDAGNHTFVVGADAFTGTLNVQAFPGGLGAQAEIATRLVYEIQDTFLGAFFNVFVTAQHLMSLTTPIGTHVCPCQFEHFVGERARGAGTYTARLTGVGVGTSGLADAILGGADARLPP